MSGARSSMARPACCRRTRRRLHKVCTGQGCQASTLVALASVRAGLTPEARPNWSRNFSAKQPPCRLRRRRQRYCQKRSFQSPVCLAQHGSLRGSLPDSLPGWYGTAAMARNRSRHEHLPFSRQLWPSIPVPTLLRLQSHHSASSNGRRFSRHRQTGMSSACRRFRSHMGPSSPTSISATSPRSDGHRAAAPRPRWWT